jgi:hypothetical protein
MEVNSLSGSANIIFSQAQQKAATAAQTIANLPVQDEEVGGSKTTASSDLFKPVLSLKEAEQETYSAVKLLKAQNHNIGTLINLKA